MQAATPHRHLEEAARTAANGSLDSRLFLIVVVLVGAWLAFFQDWAPLRQVRIQSPITLREAAATEPVATQPRSTRKKKPAAAPARDENPIVTIRPQSDAAPIGADDLPPASVREYIKKWAPLAVAEMRRTGIPASISLAQGITESRAGTSGLALTANNHFGIKCKEPGKCITGHCINFTDDHPKDYFLIFQNPFRSWKAHSDLLQSPRYQSCFRQENYRGWAYAIKKCGYATDPTYPEKLIGIINQYELYKYDL